MSTLSTVELTQMRADQAGYFNDTCVIQTHSSTQNAVNEPVSSWADGSAISCGFEMTGGDERQQADGTLLVVDGVVRVPIGTTVTELDRVKITKQHGSTLGTALVFSVAGKPKRGPSALVIDLQRVTR